MLAHTALHGYLRSPFEELEAELAALEGRIQLVRIEHSESAITLAQTLDYPILTVPTEILDKIFLSYIDSPRLGDVERRDGPLVLASVCHDWRTIVLSREELWTSLHVSLPKGRCSIGLIRRTMNFWIANAGESLVDLDITAHPSRERNALFAALPQYSTRLRSLKLKLGSRGQKYFPSAALYSGCFPYLEKLSIEDTITGGCIAFGIAPVLRHVKLFRLSYHDVEIPWAQIEYLVLDPFGSVRLNWVAAGTVRMNHALDVLRKTPSVKTLVADDPEWIVQALSTDPHHKSPSFLPNLNRLVIEGCHLNMDARNLKRIIAQRWRQEVKRAARLTSLQLIFPPPSPIL
ncbi:hypothetical protein C8F01DRAFT_1284832 [Mycena amicta]|nr:hypothetical protein C8F01DRAFT_1284832 [Mycena amicta]